MSVSGSYAFFGRGFVYATCGTGCHMCLDMLNVLLYVLYMPLQDFVSLYMVLYVLCVVNVFVCFIWLWTCLIQCVRFTCFCMLSPAHIHGSTSSYIVYTVFYMIVDRLLIVSACFSMRRLAGYNTNALCSPFKGPTYPYIALSNDPTYVGPM